MRNMARLGIGTVVAMALLWLMAASALAANKEYNWCYGSGENRPCYGTVTVVKKGTEKTWSYSIAGVEQFHGTFTKVKHVKKGFDFDYTNAASEACEVRVKLEKAIKPDKGSNYIGALWCGDNEVEALEWHQSQNK